MIKLKVKDYIEEFSLEHEHIYSVKTVLKWINLVEANVYADNIKKYLVACYPRVLGEYQFDLPSGVDFEDVKKLRVNGVAYKKKDVRAYKENRTFWFEGGKLCIYPACTETDIVDAKIRMVYLDKPATKLIADIATDTLLIPDRFSEVYDMFFACKNSFQ